MTLAAAIRNLPAIPLLGALVSLAAALIIGAAFDGRGPDLSVLPDTVAVPLATPVWVQRHEVTIDEWNACAADGACARALTWQRHQDPATTPATRINQPEAVAYAAWISQKTNHPFRLPTSAEWDAIAADVVDRAKNPLFTQPELDWASAYLIGERKTRALKASGAFSVSPDGIADLDGSVWEWTSDCYVGGGGPVTSDRCPAFWVGGEHLAAIPYLERDPARGGCAVGQPPAHLGLRLVSDRAPPEG
ncbi:formylglycine-generating enzyme family protein [Jannaschia aquimarina]|uniref:Formylglycine-generating sulfatase enzyme n=1 Tax=Jannaschia aquimarina TaxID=935700 RepID=A0A0D1EDG6_9RHOB|nr:SUMF1/EgtB/PvdO family nonheme iron enzyme [Jannaschia aquimarina]KIT15744.1 Formylglycine-generating sulfatase enzyme [Jannaschia aquimarina]SNT43673.1 Sulfatase-modifying factor enzyme 1 [Jannaschia aquimarina]